MKKNVWKIFVMLFVTMITFHGNVVKAAAPSEMEFKPGTVRLHGTTYLGDGSDNDVWIKQSVGGNYAYCIDIHKNWFETGNKTYRLTGNGDPKIAYVLENGYPNKSITGDNNRDYYITGMAIWYLISPNDSWFSKINMSAGTYNGSPSTTVVEANKLVVGANSHTTYVEPSIESFKNDDSAFKLSSDKKYYVINKPIGINTKGTVGNYTVTLTGNLPSGTVVTDINGTTKNTFSPNDSFLIKVPVNSISKLSNTIGISVSATGTIYRAYNYDFESSLYDLQAVTVAIPESKNVSKTMNLTLNIETRVEISKVDATDSKEIVGAHLVIKDSNNNIKHEWDSDGTTHIVTPMLEPGKYTLTETQAPEGYQMSSEEISFEVKADGVTIKKTMKNYPDKYVCISKQDVATEKELPGASLVLKDSKGNTRDEWNWVSSDTPYLLKLEPGKYTLTETQAPEGYVLSEETVEFTVEEDGTVKEPVIMYNEKKVEPVSTGSTLIYFAWIIGAAAIGYSIYYFKNFKKEKLEK